MVKQLIYQTKSASETKNLAAKVLKNLKNINVIALYGELGAGKTTFVQGLAKALGIKERVISPTFILAREYNIHDSLFMIHYSSLIHIDCYRINSSADLKSVDFKEYLQDKKNLVVIEWAERIRDILPKKRIDIRFKYKGKDRRKIIIMNNG